MSCSSTPDLKPTLLSPSSKLVIPIIDRWAGFGLTEGGTGGAVIRVRSLADSGPGSLHEALETTGPRLIVFEVGGVIDLRGRTLSVRHPHVTVAGQTAPDPGITLIRGSLVVQTHDVVIQHLAVRPGDGGATPPKTPWAPDALSVHRANGPVFNVLIEHCSATWAVDENLSVSGPADVSPEDGPDATAHDITLRHCLIAEALSNSTHPKGEHSKGTLVHDGIRNVAIIGCLYAHNVERNPRLKGGTRAAVVDSVMYNWGLAAVGVGLRGNDEILEPAEAVLVNNLAIAGKATRGKLFVKGLDPGGRVFLKDNTASSEAGDPLRMSDDKVVVLAELPAWASAVTSVGEADAAMLTLRRAGSRPARRDPIDARIAGTVIHGDGTMIDSQEQVGGYPVREATKHALTVPDAIPLRREWLARLSAELAEDTTLDVEPLLRRIRR